MTNASTRPSKSCHNCRRRRLRCDRSYPVCLKCAANGQQCLGYGELLRWTHAVASRGKMAGRTTFAADLTPEPGSAPDTRPSKLASCLVDPLFQDLGPQRRLYAHHFTAWVCSDLVSIDQPEQNPFRFMIPLMAKHSYLKEIVLATSAIHLATRRRCSGQPVGRELVDALSARQRAIHQLRDIIPYVTDENRSTVLAAVVFFVNFDLVDSGKGTWKAHLDAAGILINALFGRAAGVSQNMLLPDVAMARLVDVVVADCLTYHILGSTQSLLDESTASVYDSIDVSAVLRRAEAYSYHCCPPLILGIIVRATRLGMGCGPGTLEGKQVGEQNRAATASALLLQAGEFDVRGWVNSIPNLPPNDDREARVRLASAHRAAACLYIIMSVPFPAAQDHNCGLSLEGLVAEIVEHLSSVPSDHVLIKGSVWPSFMAGAQTDDPEQRQWCMLRLRSMWQTSAWICPWGYVETAMETLEGVWAVRDALTPAQKTTWNWLKQLKESGVTNCLIV